MEADDPELRLADGELVVEAVAVTVVEAVLLAVTDAVHVEVGEVVAAGDLEFENEKAAARATSTTKSSASRARSDGPMAAEGGGIARLQRAWGSVARRAFLREVRAGSCGEVREARHGGEGTTSTPDTPLGGSVPWTALRARPRAWKRFHNADS